MEFITFNPLWWLLLIPVIGTAYYFTLSDRPLRWRRTGVYAALPGNSFCRAGAV